MNNQPHQDTLLDEHTLTRSGNLAIRRIRDDDADYRRLVIWRKRPHVREWWDPDDPPPHA